VPVSDAISNTECRGGSWYHVTHWLLLYIRLSSLADYMILHLKRFLKNKHIAVNFGVKCHRLRESVNQLLSHTLLKLPDEKILSVAALNEVFNDNDGTS